MNKVLIICDDFPPFGGIRAGMLSKYLPVHGWNVDIVSYSRDYNINQLFHVKGMKNSEDVRWVINTNADECRILENMTYRYRMKNFFRIEMTRPTGLMDKIDMAIEECFKKKKYDAILATTSGHLQILSGAMHAAKSHGIPWIADMRDLIEQIPGWWHRNTRQSIYHVRAIIRRQMLLKSAFGITTISKWHANYLQRICNVPVSLIYNGYDPEIFLPHDDTDKTDAFRITYTGTFIHYYEHNINSFLKGIELFIRDKNVDANNVSLDIYSNNAHILDETLKKLRIEKFCKIHPYVSHSAMGEVLSRSSVQLLLTSSASKGVMTTKFFEYLASRKPILCVPRDDGTIAEIINQLNCGEFASSPEEVCDFLKRQYLAWQRKGNTSVNIPENKLIEFRRDTQAGQFATILNEAVSGKGNH